MEESLSSEEDGTAQKSRKLIKHIEFKNDRNMLIFLH
jgi:hypothetical protein